MSRARPWACWAGIGVLASLIAVNSANGCSQTIGTLASPQLGSHRVGFNSGLDHEGLTQTRSLATPSVLHFCLATDDKSWNLDEDLPSAGGGTVRAESRSYGGMFLRGWVAITGIEFGLLAVTATLPKDWTGWSSTFVQDGLHNLGEAYTNPPVWDDDHWFHNYIGHPYGGSVYYNTVRCQGASPAQSFFFSLVLSTQWEYIFEAVAERPSTQDLFITPVAGSILGELTHSFTQSLKKNGTTLPEKAIILILNPMSVLFRGFR